MFRQLMEVRRGRGVVDDWSWHAHNLVVAAVPAALLWVGLESIRRDMQAIEDALEDSPQESSGPTGGTKHGKHRAAPHHGTQPAVEPQPNAVPQGAAAAPATDAAIRELTQRLEMLEKQQAKTYQLEKQRLEALTANRQPAPSAASSLIASGGVDSTNTSCSTAIVTAAAESLVQQTAAGSLAQQMHHVALPPLSSTKIVQQNASLDAGNDDSQPVAVSKGAGLSGNADSRKSTGYGIPVAMLPVVGYMSYSLVVWVNGKGA